MASMGRASIRTIVKRATTFVLAMLLIIFQTGTTCTYGATKTKSSFQIDFFDVGQGDAALVQCDGHYMLVDGGDSKKSSFIYSYLKSRSIDHIDVIVATHPDADHIGGLAGALKYADVGIAYSPVKEHDTKAFRSFVKYLNSHGKSITVPKSGDKFTLGSSNVTILGPRKITSDSNNNSIVLRIEYGQTSFLFTGDAETDEEKSILESGQTIQSTVLKVAHHGSDHSTGYVFLKEVSPQYAVISVGSGNRYGHPTENLLSRLRDANVTTYRTDLQGDITCISDGKTVDFYVEKNNAADTLAGAGLGQKSNTENVTDNTTPNKDKGQVVPSESEQSQANATPQTDTVETANKSGEGGSSTENTQMGSDRIVYVTPSGSCYHYDKECAGGNAIEKSYDEAVAHYKPCGTCVLK